MRLRALLALALTALVACGSTPTRVDELKLPGTWQGTLPCADCPGIRWTLTLKPGGEYWLQRTYLGTKDGDRSFTEAARWRRGDEADRIEMVGARIQIEYLKLAPQGALQKVNGKGKAPDGAAQLLTRLPTAATAFGPVRVSALYRYAADAAMVEDCVTGVKRNLVGGPAALELERAYLALNAAGEPRRAVLSLRILPKPAAEEGWPERAEVIALEQLTDGRTCGRDAELTPESQAWTPIELDGAPLEGMADARWTFSGGRFNGALGCNSATGGYNLEPKGFSFKVLATTRMACAEPAMTREQALLVALNAVRKWTVSNGMLELRDADGAIRVRLRRAP